MCCPLCRYQEYGRQTGKRKADIKRDTVKVDVVTEGHKATRPNTNIRGQIKASSGLFNHCRLTGSQLRDLFNQKFGILTCHLCCKNFTSGQQLSNHVSKCTEVMCLKCKTKLGSKALLNKHMESCAIFACQHCPKRFISSDTLATHQLAKHPAARCDYCAATFTTDLECHAHKSDYHNFNCQTCLKAFLYTIDKMKKKFWKNNGKVLCDLCDVNNTFNKESDEIQNEDPLEVSVKRKTKRIKAETHDDSVYPVKLEMVDPNMTEEVEEVETMSQEDAFYAILPEGGTEESNMQYQCCYCKGIYDSFNELNNHLIESHNLQLQELSTDSQVEKENFTNALQKFENRIEELFETNLSHIDFENQNKYACTVCDKIFKTAITYKKHTFRAHKIHVLFSAEKQFNCQHCKAERSSLSELNKHLYSKHECTVKCEHCNSLFSSKRERKVHILSQHPDQPAFSCLDCPMKFNMHSELKQHCSWHWYHEIIDCTDCNKKIKGKKKFKIHMNYHKVRVSHGDKEIICPECGKNFSSRSSLQAHLRYVHHGGNEETVLCGDCGLLVKVRRFNRHQERMHSQGHLFRCHICSRAFFAKELLRQHMDTHIDGRPHECDQCSAAFKQVRNLRMHKRNYHSDALTSCKICNVNFSNADEYSAHRLTYHKRTPRPIKLDAEEGFQCPMCPKVLKSSRAVATHRRVAHEKHLHVKCDLCHLEFPFIRQLQSHMSSHTEPKPDLSCGFCHRTFTTLGSLNSHIKWVHVGERNFPCSFCPARFKRKDAQIVHERTHTDERPYSCSVCQRRFRQRTDCKRHEAKHSMPGFRYNKPHRVRPRAPPEVVIEEVVEEVEEGQEPGLLLAPGEDSQAAAYLSYIVHN